MFTIIIILIVALIIMAVVINAIQQHREKVESERRTQLAKLKTVVDETEDAISATSHIPVSNHLLKVLHSRVLNALRSMQEINPKAMDIKNRVNDAQERVNALDGGEGNNEQEQQLSIPDNEKQIISLIQGIKKLRTLLRAENNRGKVDPHVFSEEDKRLESMQLRINVDTLLRRGKAAMSGNMLGSARQYLEKAQAALDAQSTADDYVTNRQHTVKELLQEINDNLRDANAADRAKRKEQDNDELDELFAPKKKW